MRHDRSVEFETVRTGDGRDLLVGVTGPTDGRPFVMQRGTPSGLTDLPEISRPAAERGLRTIYYERPGYAGSTPQPGRTVLDAAGDVQAILDHLGHDRFVTVGASGGGPHALACAAALADRCAAAATLAGVAPFEADGLDWLAGMGPENVAEFAAAEQGPEALTTFLAAQADGLAAVTGEQLAEAFGQLISDVDRAALTGNLAEGLAASVRRAVSAGVDGWRDDDLAFIQPWGFALATITVPVSIWQGAQDRMVPFAHGNWLAEHIPAARIHLRPDEGHLSLIGAFDRVLDDLLDLAGW
jgi:pimeloyl-ACP methyl ester carboxylesterase